MKNEDRNSIEQLAYLINSVDGKEPPAEAKKFIHLYANGDIDYESAKSAIIKLFNEN